MIKNISHMKTLTRIFAGLAVLGAMASCQMYEIDTQMTPDKAAASIRMECSAVDSYTLPATDPESFIFNVSSNTPWTITLSSGADWLTVSPASSSASSLIADVTVTAQSNSGEDRQATLTLRGDNIALTKVITVKQTRKGRLFVTPVPGDFAACGGPLKFTIQTNQDWEVHCDQSWISFNRESGAPDPEGRTMTIVATADPSEVMERFATITVKAGDEEESFDVSQKGTFELTEIASAFSAVGEEKIISLRTDLPWTVMADKDWITFDQVSGTGDGSLMAIKATAAANEGAIRKANVKVTAGGVEKTFEVSQDGVVFEIVAPASTELARLGGEMVIGVNSSLAWEPSTDVPGWEVEKIDASSFKVKAAFNNLFQTKSGKVAIDGASGAHDELELTQDVNFTLTGHAELLSDGSVKVYEDVKSSGIVTKDNFQHVIMDADVEMHIGDKGSFFMCSEHYSDGWEYELYIDLQRSDAYRLRANGGKVTTSGSVQFTFDKAKLNAMTHAQIQFIPSTEDPGMMDMAFYCNGEKQDKVMHCSSVFIADPTLSGTYFVGSSTGKVADDGSYFIIKTCSVTPVE